MYSFYFLFFLFALFNTFPNIHADDKSKANVKKDVGSYTDKEFDDLYKEWEKNDEDILTDDEELDFYLRHPHGRRQPPAFKQEELVGNDPEKLFKTMKRGQKTIVFVSVSGNPTKRETQEISEIWWIGLRNAQFDVHKYVVDNDRIVFLVHDGSLAYDIKDYLVKQPRCLEVTIDNRQYPGKGARKMPKFKLVEL